MEPDLHDRHGFMRAFRQVRPPLLEREARTRFLLCGRKRQPQCGSAWRRWRQAAGGVQPRAIYCPSFCRLVCLLL